MAAGERARSQLKPLVAASPQSGVEACRLIRENPREAGWVVKDPSRYSRGQVWTQNQCFEHPVLKSTLKSVRPENIVKFSETKAWVIEAKSRKAASGQVLKEAENDCVVSISKGRGIRAVLTSGVVGNGESGYGVRTKMLVHGHYESVTINGVEATGLLDPRTVETPFISGGSDVTDYQVNGELFLRIVEQVNATLRNGGINRNGRSRVVAALLLTLVETASPNLEGDLPALTDDIDNRTDSTLRRHRKWEFYPFVGIEPPTNPDSRVKYKAAIVRTVQQLPNLNTKSAVNSGTDVLDKLYEAFLHYDNGAKEVGIVLTPKHIARFAVDAVGVSPSDLIFDPTCGTGGLPVVAFGHVQAKTKGAPLERLKRFGLFGIEQESPVVTLAIVNMTFRGDGKNSIVEADCFNRSLTQSINDGHATAQYVKARPKLDKGSITRVSMDPPSVLKKSDEHEWRFVETALKSMADGALLLAIVPMSVVSKGGSAGAWRRPLLEHHSVIAVVSLSEELFYPVAV